MDFESAILITSITYLIFLVWIYIFSKKYKCSLILFILLLSIITPYNLLITKIANQQLTTIFTFIYRYKILKISFLDFLLIVCFCLYFFKIIKSKIKVTKLIKGFFIRDIVYLTIGTFSFIYFNGYVIDGGRTYLGYCRGFIYTWMGYVLISYFLSKNKDFYLKDVIKIIKILMIFSVFNSLFYTKGEVWSRFGNKVTILSQEWATFYAIILVVYIFFDIKNKKIKKKSEVIFFIFMLITLKINSYKGNIIYLAFLFPYYILFYKKITLKRIITLQISFLAVLLIFITFMIKFQNNIAINTRKLQVKQYITHISECKNPIYAYLFGSGIGSAYKGKMGDFGESYAIDREKYGEYKFSIQTPILSNFKDVGIIGVIFCIFFDSLFILYILLQNKILQLKKDEEYLTVTYIISYNLLTLVIFQGVPSVALFNGALYAIYNKKIKGIKK